MAFRIAQRNSQAEDLKNARQILEDQTGIKSNTIPSMNITDVEACPSTGTFAGLSLGHFGENSFIIERRRRLTSLSVEQDQELLMVSKLFTLSHENLTKYIGYNTYIHSHTLYSTHYPFQLDKIMRVRNIFTEVALQYITHSIFNVIQFLRDNDFQCSVFSEANIYFTEQGIFKLIAYWQDVEQSESCLSNSTYVVCSPESLGISHPIMSSPVWSGGLIMRKMMNRGMSAFSKKKNMMEAITAVIYEPLQDCIDTYFEEALALSYWCTEKAVKLKGIHLGKIYNTNELYPIASIEKEGRFSFAICENGTRVRLRATVHKMLEQPWVIAGRHITEEYTQWFGRAIRAHRQVVAARAEYIKLTTTMRKDRALEMFEKSEDGKCYFFGDFEISYFDFTD